MRFYARNLVLAAVILSFIPVVTGCSMLGGPKKKPEVSKEDVSSMVKQEMKSPETQKTIEDAVAGNQLKDLLKSSEADKLMEKKMMENMETPKVSKAIQEQLQNALRSPDSQKVLQEHIKKAMATPDVQQNLNTMVQQALTKMMQSGQKGGGSAGTGGSSGGGSSSGGGQ